MARIAANKHRAPLGEASLRLGERLRQLRVAADMTQTDLAGDRFSKEYVSQIERSKTRPTRETMLRAGSPTQIRGGMRLPWARRAVRDWG